jgi:hypothetical protein
MLEFPANPKRFGFGAVVARKHGAKDTDNIRLRCFRTEDTGLSMPRTQSLGFTGIIS